MPPADAYDASATAPKLDLLRLIKQLVKQCYPAGCTAFLSKFSPHPSLLWRDTLSQGERGLLPLVLWERGRGEGDFPHVNELGKGLQSGYSRGVPLWSHPAG